MRFLYESQIREYLADAFLEELVGSKAKIHTEVPVKRCGHDDGIADYLTLFGTLAIPVEAKLLASSSDYLQRQLEKYLVASICRRDHRNIFGEWTASKLLLVDGIGVSTYELLDSALRNTVSHTPWKTLALLTRSELLSHLALKH